MLVSKTVMGNGAYSAIHYYKPSTLRRHFPGGSPQDCIRLVVVQPMIQKEPIVDFLMTPGEAIDIVAGITSALQEAVEDEVPYFHQDKTASKRGMGWKCGAMTPPKPAVYLGNLFPVSKKATPEKPL